MALCEAWFFGSGSRILSEESVKNGAKRTEMPAIPRFGAVAGALLPLSLYILLQPQSFGCPTLLRHHLKSLGVSPLRPWCRWRSPWVLWRATCAELSSQRHTKGRQRQVLPILHGPVAREARALGVRLPSDLPLPPHELTGTEIRDPHPLKDLPSILGSIHCTLHVYD